MSQKSTKSTQAGWALLRLALRTNHRQELIDNQAAEEQAKFRLDQRHHQEMAQISSFLNPLGWTQTISRYRAQQEQTRLINQASRQLTLARQQTESVELDAWITQQQQAIDLVLFDQLRQLFKWSLTAQQQQSYHQSLSAGYTLIITDIRRQFLWASQNFVSLTGYELKEVVGRRAALLQGPTTDGATVAYVREQLDLAQAVEVELVNYTKKGVSYLCHMRIEPLYNYQGSLTHFLAMEQAL